MNKYANRTSEDHNAFDVAKQLYKDTILDKALSRERRNQKITAALEFFDQAIEKGHDTALSFSFRGNCLSELGYNIDALEDYDKSIAKDPQKANPYYMRALIKKSIYDYEGSLADFKEAIRLSKLDNEDNEYWNSYAKNTGYNSATEKYEMDLNLLSQDLIIYKERVKEEHWRKKYDAMRANIKRRGQ
jgi:tetratricopeptide (TPR) repeat protein